MLAEALQKGRWNGWQISLGNRTEKPARIDPSSFGHSKATEAMRCQHNSRDDPSGRGRSLLAALRAAELSDARSAVIRCKGLRELR